MARSPQLVFTLVALLPILVFVYLLSREPKEDILPSFDLSQISTFFRGLAYGYISMDTLEWLGETRDFHRMQASKFSSRRFQLDGRGVGRERQADAEGRTLAHLGVDLRGPVEAAGRLRQPAAHARDGVRGQRGESDQCAGERYGPRWRRAARRPARARPRLGA